MSTNARQATVKSASTLLNGIDVASFQHPNGASINWANVAAAGYQFAAIKVTENTNYVNPYYATDAPAAVAAGMYVSAYHFAIPNASGGASQADWAYQNAGNYKVGGNYLPLMLDAEYDPYNKTDHLNECYGLTPSAMVSWISSFMTEATTLTGAAPIIYTPPSWWDTCTANSTAFGGDVLWVPSYSAQAPGSVPAGWGNWTLWQYTSVGSVPGITGPVDLDYFSGGAYAEQTPVNASASIQIQALTALAGQQLTYSATGLPPGVSISSAGLITGAPASAGVYQVTVTPQGSGTVLPASLAFTWGISAPPAVAVGVEGLDGELWARAPQVGGGWHPLGGVITAPPAVAAAPNPDGNTPADPLFVATGTDKSLWIRSATAGWQPVGAARCIGGPAAAVTGTAAPYTVTLACRGLNNALWVSSTTWPGTGLPSFTGPWTSLGGVLSAAPAAAPVGATMTFFVRGTNGAVFTRTAAAGYSPTSWFCIGFPAAAQQTVGGITTFACQGTDHALWEATSAGAGWSTVSLGGVLIGGPAVAATSRQTEFFAEGTSRAVYQNTAAVWTSLGGQVIGGVGAAALN